MKKKITKKDFAKFTKRNTHKRREKNRAMNELYRAVQQTNVGYTDAILHSAVDLGRRGRVTTKRGREEIRVRGIYQGSRAAFGFVTPEEGYDRDIFIPEGKTLGAIHGDFVEIIYHIYKSHDGEEKTEGRVTKIIEFGRSTVIGTLTCEPSYMRSGRRIRRRWLVIPDDPKVAVTPEVINPADAREGDKVAVRLLRDSGAGNLPRGEIVSNFGDATSKEANYEAILAECEIPTDFTPEELEQAMRAASAPLTDEGRERFAGHVIMTIDGAGAKDLDDAVSLKKTGTGWQLCVHIADVSAYVEEKTPLDRAVMARGTSVYFTDKVVPMLPPALSNGACSLNADEDKYALSAVISLDRDGAIKSVRVTPSVIRSRVRGVYSEVNAILEDRATPELLAKYKAVIPTLLRMKELHELLRHRYVSRGALELDIAEAEVLLDAEGEPVDIVRRERGEAEKMIEQFMLCANEAVAGLLYGKGIPCVYRVHAAPPEDKLSDLLSFAHNLGFDTSVVSMEKCEPRDLAALLSEAESRELSAPVSYAMLRAMSKAEYSEVKDGHFGLGIETYCHFTSPIRRLSDLATHRIIRRVLLEGKPAERYASYARRAARAATEAENRALAAERRIENLYKVIYMSDRVGEEFDATVSSVTAFGLFAQLDNTCEGLIPLSEMPGFFVFDEKNLIIRSQGEVYHLGDKVRVRLEEADISRGKLRFSLVL